MWPFVSSFRCGESYENKYFQIFVMVLTSGVHTECQNEWSGLNLRMDC